MSISLEDPIHHNEDMNVTFQMTSHWLKNEVGKCFLNGPFPYSFFIYFRLLYTVDRKFAIIAIMTGFEPHTSCVRSDRSSN